VILLPRTLISSDAMDMHMYGFKTVWSSDTSCIMVFFSNWLLNTKVRRISDVKLRPIVDTFASNPDHASFVLLTRQNLR